MYCKVTPKTSGCVCLCVHLCSLFLPFVHDPSLSLPLRPSQSVPPLLPSPPSLSASLPLSLAVLRFCHLHWSPGAKEPKSVQFLLQVAWRDFVCASCVLYFALTPTFQVKMEKLYTAHLNSLKADSSSVREGIEIEEKRNECTSVTSS